ncbi:MAG: PepSY domain-containing protein [Robiginitomaculum sp.]
MTSRQVTSRRFFALLTRVHKWAGLVIGIQILLWTASGLFMTVFPISQIRGNAVAEKASPVLMDMEVISIGDAAGRYDGKIKAVTLTSLAGRSAYIIEGDEGRTILEGRDGAPWQGASEADVRAAAALYYKEAGEPQSVALLTGEAPLDYRNDMPIWRVTYDDSHNTRLYIDPSSAQLRGVRTQLWRVYDFMWMLHIMDYKGRDNFNNWIVRFAAFCGLLFALSGIGLLIHRFALRPKPSLAAKRAAKREG